MDTCEVDGVKYETRGANPENGYGCSGCAFEVDLKARRCYVANAQRESGDCRAVIWVKAEDQPAAEAAHDAGPVRAFGTGATRSSDAGRYDPEGFMSPIVVERFAQYMNKHRVQPDGSIRASDNWQKGIPRDAYMKGMWRHFLHLWTRHRGYTVQDPLATDNIEEDLCSILFNASGMLFEILKQKPEVNPKAGE